MCDGGGLVVPDAAESRLAQSISGARLSRAKRAFATRRIQIPANARLIAGNARPKPGNLVLAQVGAIGHHTRLELISGRRATLHVGDEILVVYGDRYAPDQFEALTPANLDPCNLVAGGGIASSMIKRADRARKPTKITPVGLLADANGVRLSTRDFALPPIDFVGARPLTIAVLGTAMNSGKTATMAALARGGAMTGRQVGAAKLTGTGSGGDLWSYLDAGAAEALDFTDAGYATTYRLGLSALEQITTVLASQLAARKVDVVLLEVSDGLLLDDTASLANSPVFRDMVDGVVFAATDSMGAVAGEAWLREAGYNVIAITGQMTRSPMLAAEAAQRVRAPVLSLEDIAGGAWLPSDALGDQALAHAV